jgi:dipeptidyl aminopeptidase/acylaminoacyl peptidase
MRMHPVLARFFFFAIFAIFFLAVTPARAQEDLKYQTPPKGIVDLVDVLPTPSVAPSPAGASVGARWLLIQDLSGLPPIADLAQPELRLAGLRFNPRTNGPSRGRYATSLKLKQLPDGKEITVRDLPPNAKIRFASWSPDGTKIAFVNASNAKENVGLDLWIVDANSARAQHVAGIELNGIFGSPCEWRNNAVSLICRTVPLARGPAPVRNEIPDGPVIQENLGRVTPGATYEDLLKNSEDQEIFDYYATSQLALIQLDGTSTPLGKPGVIADAKPSPDGLYVLVSERHRPYSYLLPFEMFPERMSVVTVKDGTVKQLSDRALQDNIPNIHDAVPSGPREYQWRSDVPATIAWVEAGDGGDPRKEAAVRDTLFISEAPFEGGARKLVELPVRFSRVGWTENQIALVQESRWKDRKRIILAVHPSTGAAPVKLFEGSSEDRYNDPGQPVEITNKVGQKVIATTADHSAAYFRGEGASPEGDKPFVSTMSFANGDTKKLWHSDKPYYEIPWDIMDTSALAILIRRESPQQSPNFYIWKSDAATPAQVTSFPSPYGSAAIPTKQVLKYTRADGVELNANLYLPPGYKKEDGPLPTLIEAYPTEYKTKSSAGQITGSPYEFVFLYWGSPVPFVTQGYAVLENASIPIVGEGNAEPNDTYVDQLVASAKAAIDEGVRLGVVDRNRVAVTGHSYGAFMTVNLLAHSDLFKAGIARSGAYNRTLTPFGFQNEDRTYWQAPDVYNQMSPFMHADKIKTPLLLIHGEADNNSGTFPIQSERLFSALKGQGATVRFVLLPLEAHGYAARESVLDMFWEMNTWMSTYVKRSEGPSAPAPGMNQ